MAMAPSSRGASPVPEGSRREGLAASPSGTENELRRTDQDLMPSPSMQTGQPGTANSIQSASTADSLGPLSDVPPSRRSIADAESHLRLESGSNEVQSRPRQEPLVSWTPHSSLASSPSSSRRPSVHHSFPPRHEEETSRTSTRALSTARQRTSGISAGNRCFGNAPLHSMAQPHTASQQPSSSHEFAVSPTSSSFIPISIPRTPGERSIRHPRRRSSLPNRSSDVDWNTSDMRPTVSSLDSPRRASTSGVSTSSRGKRRREDDGIGDSSQSTPPSQRAGPSTRISFSGSSGMGSRQSSLTGSARADSSRDRLPPIDLHER